jgi:adhesin transport system outer membrane protein
MKPLLMMMLLAAIPSSHALTVEESAALAVRTQPQIIGKYSRYESARSETQSARGDYLPQVSLRAGVGPEKTWYNTGKKTDTDLTRQDGNLRITQKVFDGFRTPANVARLNFETESERMGLISAAENLLLDVTAAYLEVRKQEEIVELAKRNVVDHEQVLTDLKSQLSQGYASESDIAQVVSRLANARSSVVAANNNLADARSRYKRLVGQSPEQLVTPRFDSKLMPASLEAAETLAIDKHPELKAAKADIDASQQEIRVNQSGYYPQVSVEAEYNRDNNHGGFDGRDENGRVMLMLNYDIFNGGRDYHRSEASAWRYQEARSISLKAEREVREGVELAWNAYLALADQLGFLQQSVDAATAAEAGYTQQYKLGRRTLLDVLNAKIEVFVARRNYISSVYDHKQAAYRIMNATGQLSYALRVDLPSQFALQE